MSLNINDMCMVRLALSIILIALHSVTRGQDYFTVNKDEAGINYIEVNIAPGFTLYGLAKATGQNTETLKEINNKNSKSLVIGQVLRIPIDPSMIVSSQKSQHKQKELFYTVRPGDNLYNIAQGVSGSTDDLKAINAKLSNRLDIGERLLLGWIDWPYGEALVKQKREITLVESLVQDRTFEQVASVRPRQLFTVPKNTSLHSYNGNTQIVKEKGIAYWEKSDYVSRELIVMHPTARLDSKISLYNPMMDRKVEAKVVSEMPSEAFPKDISVVISPSVANALGALDKRFLVEITYVE